ncbi:hypothetical protein [Marinomonas shanghaiensis]|uniref:hypothetical protein n=1 Tax=Marinomonas shanghaiensis TaxID=2202418 RepID=UPI003A8F0334
MLIVVLFFSIALYLVREENKPIRIELGKVLLTLLTVFLGVFLGQFFSNEYNYDREKEHTIKLLRVTHMELQALNEYLLAIPQEYEKAKLRIRGYTPRKLFDDNAIVIPKIVSTTLADTNIIRVMHPQSIKAIFSSLENSEKVINILNSRELSEEALIKIISQGSVHLMELGKYVEYEVEYQLGDLSEDDLFDRHRSQIDYFKKNPVDNLTKLK